MRTSKYKKSENMLQNKLLRDSIKSLNLRIFIFIVTLFIIANTIVLSLDRYPQSASELAALNTANLVFTLFFMIEMFIKLFGILRDLTFRLWF